MALSKSFQKGQTILACQMCEEEKQKPSGQIHDFNNIKCDRHAGKICCLFCTDCEEVVCPLCITKAHNTHYMIELSEGFKVAMEVLRDLHASKDEDLTKLNTQRMTLQTIKTEVQARYSEEKRGILHQEKVLTELVHEQSEKLISKLDARLNKIAISIQSDEHQTNADYRATESRNQIFQDAIDSKDMLKVFKTVGKE
ncbi:Hypothetical predicted protein [Mytilus galloprovincialis]|uniref:B box-type domain-containing protein n=1 Tax=Mytilus galloprovincialis TaxID=29158 RepID=A0A8B6HA82_MYTGA|nr:Hypothetical predicted protein [Mytilus galloprovincialis]